jgi:branched-chain amino acid transport system permease protein
VTKRRSASPTRVVVVLALAAVAPLFFSASGDVINNMTLAAAYVLMALGLNVIVGFAGLLDLGYVAFFAIGAYTAAYFGSSYWAGAGAHGQGLHFNFLLILALAVAATSIAGVVIGVPTLRLRGDYIALVTLAFGEIIGEVVSNGRSIHLFGGTLTPGPIGLGPIDPIDLPLVGRFERVFDLRPWYWFALVLVALALVVNVNLRGSRLGRAWIAIRDDEVAAGFAGIPVVRAKLAAYGIGAAFGGVSGAFLASYLSYVNAGQFEFSFSIFILAMVVLGGLGSLPGVVVGAIGLSVVNNYLLPDVLFDLPSRVGLSFDLSTISSGIYGAILVIVVLLRPQGLVPGRWAVRRPAAALRGARATAARALPVGREDPAIAVVRARSADAVRASVRAAYAREEPAPLRRCPNCGLQAQTWFERCSACGTSYFERRPRLSRRARVGLAGLAAVSLAVLVGLVEHSAEHRVAANRAAQGQQLARERARIIAAQRPHRARAATRDEAQAPAGERLAARRRLVRDVERAISRDARGRGAVVSATACGPIRRDLPRDELDLSKPIGRYDCVAVTSDVRQRGTIVGQLGVPYVAAIQFHRGRLTWCKNNPAPSERGKLLVSVRLAPACLGLPPDAKPVGAGYALPG